MQKQNIWQIILSNFLFVDGLTFHTNTKLVIDGGIERARPFSSE